VDDESGLALYPPIHWYGDLNDRGKRLLDPLQPGRSSMRRNGAIPRVQHRGPDPSQIWQRAGERRVDARMDPLPAACLQLSTDL